MNDLHVVAISVVSIGILAVAVKWLMSRASRRFAGSAESLALDAKPYFFSASENRFFTALLPAAHALDLVIFPKVRLADLVLDRKAAVPATFEGYAQLCVDYLLVTRHDYRPVAGIELASGSHPLDGPQAHGPLKVAFFEAVRLPLLRLSPQDALSDLELRTKLARAIERDPLPQA